MTRIIVFGLTLATTAAASPGALRHQGRLLGPSGESVDGDVSVALSLYAQASGGAAQCTETDVVTAIDGYFATSLGDGSCDLSLVDFEATTWWIGVAVNGGAEMVPRSEVFAAPVARVAIDGGSWEESGSDIYYSLGDVAIGATTAHPSAALDVASTTRGLLPPRVTTTQRNAIASPAAGLVVFNTTLSQLQLFDGTAWTSLSPGPEAVPVTSGGVMTWGGNAIGELGNGSTTATNYPTEIAASGTLVDISMGGYAHGQEGASCYIDSAGALYCTGAWWMIPGNTNVSRTTYAQMAASQTWRSVHIGNGLVGCGVTTSNQGYCWGYRRYGGHGVNEDVDAYTTVPVPVTGGFSWKEISVGGRYTGSFHFAFACGVTTATTGANGYCWGRDDYGVLGNGGNEANHNQAGPASGQLSSITWDTIEAGFYHVCGVSTAGVGYCWGYNGYGQLGDNSTSNRVSPTIVQGSHTWKKITVGERHSCGLRTDGAVLCWGSNGDSQMGDGTTAQRNTPTAVLGSRRFVDISAGQWHTCALDAAGAMWCWGYNGYGQLGVGNTTNLLAPTQIYGAQRFKALDAGIRSTSGLMR